MLTENRVDVAIVGAGPSGSAAAVALAREGIKVALLDLRHRAGWKIGETLPPAARPMLRELGVLSDFEADGHLPSYGNLSSWGFEDVASADFIFNPYGNGWQLDRERFEERLATVARLAGTRLCYDCQVVSARKEQDGWELGVRSQGQEGRVWTRWLVDATGRASVVARQLGAQRTAIDRLVCVYSIATTTTVGKPKDEDTRTLVEAAADGWWYAALTPNGRRTVAWVTDADIVSRQPWRQPGWFRIKVEGTRHICAVLDGHGYEFPDPPRCTVASSSRLVPCCGSGWLAVGDAALAFDPLSSQGLFNAMATGLVAARTIASTLGGDRTAPERYAKELESAWSTYLRSSRDYYRMEGRWGGEVFWTRRR